LLLRVEGGVLLIGSLKYEDDFHHTHLGWIGQSQH